MQEPMVFKAVKPSKSSSNTMTKLLLILVTVGLWSGCEIPDLSASPTKGPEGQRLRVYHGEDSEGNSTTYQFYLSGPDTVKHGDYYVYYESGETRIWIQFYEGKRHGFEISYSLKEGCDPSCRTIHTQLDNDYWRDGKCVGSGYRECEGDEYEGY
jgi:hypothetical protein